MTDWTEVDFDLLYDHDWIVASLIEMEWDRAKKEGRRMSCEKCEVAQRNRFDYYIRWKNANVKISGCKQHIKEVIDALRETQSQNIDDKPEG